MTQDYDKIATKYDKLFSDIESLRENYEVRELLSKYFKTFVDKTVIDIGCGTGLLLEMFDIDPRNYVGIDPSQKMLDIFKKKVGVDYKLVCTDFEGVLDYLNFDYVISLFGSCSYVDPKILMEKIKKISPDGKYFLMFFRPFYYPVTYLKSGVEMKHNQFDDFKLEGGYQHNFNNFVIYTNEIL